MRKTRRFAALFVVSMAAIAATASAAQAWAPADSATIRPGSQTYTEGAQCTSNFVFQDGGNVYVGQAAHCSGTGAATDTDGCDAGSLPIGTPVEVEGASKPGTLVYNSWITMQAGRRDQRRHLRLQRLRPGEGRPGGRRQGQPDRARIWGGPTGLGATHGQRRQGLPYGNSSLRGGVATLSPKSGNSLGCDGGGWTHTVYTATPGIPGDSGSGFMDAAGPRLRRAEHGRDRSAGGLQRRRRREPNEIAYMHSHGGPAASLVNGTEPFTGPLLPL